MIEFPGLVVDASSLLIQVDIRMIVFELINLLIILCEFQQSIGPIVLPRYYDCDSPLSFLGEVWGDML